MDLPLPDPASLSETASQMLAQLNPVLEYVRVQYYYFKRIQTNPLLFFF